MPFESLHPAHKTEPVPPGFSAVSPFKDSLPGPALSFLPHSVNFSAKNNFRRKPVLKDMLLLLRMRL